MIIKIAVMGICVCVITSVMKSFFKEAVLPIELAFAVIAAAVVVDKIKDTAEKLWDFFGATQTEEASFSALLKGALICIVSSFASDTAKDSGNSLVADIIDFSGRILLLTVGFPFFESVIKTALNFLP